MSSKLRKHLKFVPQFFTVLGALSMAFALLLSVVNVPVMANGQETCPDGGDWEKKDGLSGTSYNYDAPTGKLIVEWCYKSSTTVNYGSVNPPQASVSITSTVKNDNNKVQDISHASFRLIDKPADTPVPPTLTPSNTPTNTPVPPTITPSNTPTNTAVPDDPTQTPGGPTATNTEMPPTLTPTNTEVPPEATPTLTEEVKDPDPTATPVLDETPVPTGTPVNDETPDPTEPPVVEDEPEPTLAPPVTNDQPTVLIPVTGIELGGNSPLSDVQNMMFNLGLSFLGVGLVLQSLRKRLNF